MSVQSYTDYVSRQSRSTTSTKKDLKKVGYFTSLRNDGDEAIVRFDYGNQDDFNVVSVHVVKVRINDRDMFRSVSCLKQNAYDADDVCPLCKSGDKAKYKAYLKMLEYVRDESGKVVPSPVCWERPSMFVKDVVAAAKDAIDNGFFPVGTPIRSMIFKIRRNGAAKSRETTYRVSAVNPAVFPAEVYVPDFSGFEGFEPSRHSYMNKTAEDMTAYLSTGSFPAPVKAEEPAQAIPQANSISTSAPSSNVETRTYGTSTPTAPTTPVAPAAEPAPERPRRTYTF